MATRIFNLRHVPDDEADDIRVLLADNQIETTETRAGVLGIGSAAIWVVDEANVTRAQALLDEYQQQRTHAARQRYLDAKAAGTAPTISSLFLRNPLKHLLYLLALLAIIYFMLAPFFLW